MNYTVQLSCKKREKGKGLKKRAQALNMNISCKYFDILLVLGVVLRTNLEGDAVNISPQKIMQEPLSPFHIL